MASARLTSKGQISAWPPGLGNRPPADELGLALRTALIVERMGYLVPCGDFDGVVHSVFARACNIMCDGSLLTLVVAGVSDSPTTLVLRMGASTDFRTLFRLGDHVVRRGLYATAHGATLYFGHATLWQPAPPRPSVADVLIAANLRLASACLAQHRHRHTSVIDREASTTVTAIADACARLDGEKASRHAQELIGWGEGLTPAGDDFLIGLCAALTTLAGEDASRRAFLFNLSAAIAAGAWRTTPIAAHYLRLAAQRHFTADLTDLRDAVLAEVRPERLLAVLDRALRVGATSGADAVTGLLTGFGAWYRPRCTA